MGITAIIYNTEREIIEKYKISKLLLSIDEKTGEIYIKDNITIKTDSIFNNIHLEITLGNLTKIQYLFFEFKEVLMDDSIILSKILYNGSHSGDIIQNSDLSNLHNEIVKLKKHYLNKNKEINIFINAVETLVKAAEETNNPIVFV